MAKLLTLREGELFRVCVGLAHQLQSVQNAPITNGLENPPSRLDVAIDLEKKMSFDIEEDDVHEAAEIAGV